MLTPNHCFICDDNLVGPPPPNAVILTEVDVHGHAKTYHTHCVKRLARVVDRLYDMPPAYGAVMGMKEEAHATPKRQEISDSKGDAMGYAYGASEFTVGVNRDIVNERTKLLTQIAHLEVQLSNERRSTLEVLIENKALHTEVERMEQVRREAYNRIANLQVGARKITAQLADFLEVMQSAKRIDRNKEKSKVGQMYAQSQPQDDSGRQQVQDSDGSSEYLP